MPNVLITGAGRGLGLEFARQYAADGWRVQACLRDPSKAAALQAIKGNVTIQELDPCNPAQVAALGKSPGGAPIDLLINNAGTYGPREDNVAKIGYEDWLETFRLNSIAPLKVAAALADRVAASERKLMVFITSLMGSIERLTPGAYPYRMSKAALNAGVKGLSQELAPRGITMIVIHPGWVQTDMGGPTAPVKPTDSIAGMRSVIAKVGKKDNGRFFGYDGESIPW